MAHAQLAPVVVHLPLVGLVLAVAFDLVAAQNRSARWRDAATVLWWAGLLGAAAAVTTGLLAYNRVEHSDPAHVEMVLHRNLALAAVTVLLVTAVWRWRRPYSRRAYGTFRPAAPAHRAGCGRELVTTGDTTARIETTRRVVSSRATNVAGLGP